MLVKTLLHLFTPQNHWKWTQIHFESCFDSFKSEFNALTCTKPNYFLAEMCARTIYNSITFPTSKSIQEYQYYGCSMHIPQVWYWTKKNTGLMKTVITHALYTTNTHSQPRLFYMWIKWIHLNMKNDSYKWA
jgi:hypothetical protein